MTTLDHERAAIGGHTTGDRGDQDQTPQDTHLDITLDADEDTTPRHDPVYVDATVREHTELPVIPAAWRGWANIRSTVHRAARYYGHVAAYHAVRLPQYAILLAFWAVVGAGKVTWRFLRWVGDPDGRPTRDDRATGETMDAWRRQREDHHAHVKHRLWGLVVGLVVLSCVGLLVATVAPWWVQALVVLGGVPALAAYGKPRHRHIVTPAVVTPRVRRLNADIVLRAYYAAQLGHPEKPDQQIAFGSPMARDGEGSTVAIDLPYGKGFRDAMGKREAIASGLDVAVSQVYLTRDATSNRRHRLWVADRDPLAVPAGRTPLLRLQPTDIWQPAPFGVDERGRRVELPMVWNSILVGAQPRQGKSFSARALALYAAMDPHVKLTVFDAKGSPDWRGFSKVADRYGFGLAMTRDGDPTELLVEALAAVKKDVQDRYRRLSEMPTEMAPEGKLTRELARDRRQRMPVHVVVLDEFQEYFDLGEISKDIAALLVHLVKVAPGAGVILLCATQRPSGIGTGQVAQQFTSFRDNFQVRFSLRTGSYQMSDLVLGAGAYSEGHDSSTLLPTYKGVGILRGHADDTPTTRVYLADGQDADKILTTARALREQAGTLTGMAAGEDLTRETRDPLADVIRVFAHMGRVGLHWGTVADELAKLAPDRYAGEDADSISALLRGLGVRSQDVKAGGEVRKGCRREAVEEALNRREVGSGSGATVPATRPDGASEPVQ